ncbi:glycosyltransferase family 4 protein [Psychrosphaera sp. F3M07]|uniref:glycosyltransferase family 4 protein n=1 Tax=Psychrosphaera sp. F3M07 TaxID=2841560 RepID=UPI001C0A2A50|nr:glycosyltransferase family 4 protein [Psychrosphaera sp. F3M07]MBU2917740.1 glycosyltransferase family 4 protein [Psychrosphaera sp. F3M07]
MNRLIYVSNSIIPSQTANSLHVMKMCNGFSLNQYDVTLLAKTNSASEKETKIFEIYNVPQTFNLYLSKLGRLPIHSLFISLVIFPLKIFTLKDSNDFIYSRNRHTSFILSLMGLKQYYEMHGIPKSKVQLLMDKFIVRNKNTVKLITISECLKLDVCKTLGVDIKKVTVLHDGADVIDIDSIQIIKLLGNKKVNLGYVGSLLEGKGVDLICEAALLLPDIGFHIIGGTRKQIGELNKHYISANNLFFYGYKEQDDVQRYIKSFDAVILPNKKNVITSNGEDIGRYTSPLKMFEYLSFNKLIISANLEVLQEVLSDKEAKFFNESSITSLVNIIKGLGDIVPTEGAKLIESKFSWQLRAKSAVNS